MRILFLGTGAADWPIEKMSDIVEHRRFSSALIDNTLLIDPGPQVLEALDTYGISRKKIKYIINTHTHSDHFCKNTVEELKKCGAEFICFAENETKQIGKYTVFSFKGNHSTCEKTLHFIITDNEKTVFYGLDGAWLMYDEVQAIKKFQPDLAVLDATIGDIEGDYRIFEHNNLNMVLEMKSSLKQWVKSFCISHMAFTLHKSHKELAEKMKKHNIITAYDGFEIRL